MSLDQKQITNGFWYHNPRARFPPQYLSYPEAYQGGARLNLVCTQLDIGSYKQKKLVDQWCQLLPEMGEVRFLWLNSRTPHRLFEAACQMPALEGLYVKWGAIKDISSLVNLPNLEYLSIGSSPQVGNIEVFQHLPRLRVLEIENFKKVRSLEPLRGLVQLEGLGVQGSIWTEQLVESLEPLSSLQNLRYLLISNLRAQDNSLLHLKNLTSLENLVTAFWWRKSDFVALRKTLPNLKHGSVFDDELIERFGKG